MRTGDPVISSFLGSLDCCDSAIYPFRHWLLNRVLPDDVCAAIDRLDVAPPPIEETLGRRETHNSSRLFFGVEQRAAHPVCDAVACALQSGAVVSRLEQLCDVTLDGSFARIEYCLDTEGFWLEPHTDIGAKLFTMLVYLSDDPGSEAWGTDLLDGPDTLVATVPFQRNSGCIFIPAADTWHGFRRRPIVGVRRSLIVNYVRPEWRSRHELAFPDQAVMGGG
ncbi:MAG: hypothetical protein QOH05_110 [Acetobacteraceae bacterium]|jgi:hypothetical protein|nr:hypothetical protein [Acetobacteraceae bacterium]